MRLRLVRLRLVSCRAFALGAVLLSQGALGAAGPCGGGMSGGRMGGGGGSGGGMGLGGGGRSGGNCSSGQMGMQSLGRNALQSGSGYANPYNYYPLMTPQAGTYTPPSPTSTPVKYAPSYVLPTPSAQPDSSNAHSAPAEPANRMRYVELTVTGIERNADSNRISTALEKLDGSRGASVKRTQGGGATVKLWYSEKDPVSADAAKQAVEKLGFKAELVGG